MKGLLIAFEGIDGSGKFTQLMMARDWIKKAGYFVKWSSEPNDESPIGKTIRGILNGDIPMPEDPAEFQRMYVIDRGQDIFAFINPSIERNKNNIYLIERFALSTIAYGMLSGESAESFIEMHERVLGPSILWPNLSIIIDVSGKEGSERIAESRDKPEFFEKADLLEKVRQNYLKIAGLPKFQDRTVIVSGDRAPDEVFEDIKKAIEPILPTRK